MAAVLWQSIAVCRTLTFIGIVESTKTTFTKLEQCSWIKIEVIRSRSTQECFQALREAYGNTALPYCIVAQYVKMFREGREAVRDNIHTGRRHEKTNTVQLLVSLSDADRRWTERELAAEVGVCHKIVFQILHDILGYRKLAVRSIPHEISEVKE